MSERYYSFMFGDKRAGYQVVTVDGGKQTKEIRTVFEMQGNVVKSSHVIRFNDDGSIKEYNANGGKFHSIPQGKPNHFPTSAYEEIISKMRISVGEKFVFTALLDGTGEELGKKTMVVSKTFEYTNPITNQKEALFKIDEETEGKIGRYFLVDKTGQIHEAFWSGPRSVLVDSKDEALRGLNLPKQ